MACFIGTSGWQYPHWRGIFYPSSLKSERLLQFYCNFFKTVEVNVTFYRQPSITAMEKWYKSTPADFLFSLKMPRFITHIKRLRATKQNLDSFLTIIESLMEKCGVILIQLPPSLRFDQSLIEDFLSLLDNRFKYAMEVRNKTFIECGFFDLLRKRNIAWCISDSAGKFPYHEIITADFAYVRLHGSKILYASSYSDDELLTWKKKIIRWGKETFVYFDNDYMGFAIQNALKLKEMVEKP